MINNKITILLFALVLSSGANAQKDTTLTRRVVVENQYNPEILDASKVNVLPRVDQPKVNKRAIEYINKLQPTSKRINSPIAPIENDIQEDKAKNGEIVAGYGNYGNVILTGKYTWMLTDADKLKVSAGLIGMNGTLNGWNDEDWKSRFYSSHVAADYTHLFKRIELSVGGKYNSQVYNYMNIPSGDKQHNNIVNFYAGIKSLDESFPLQFILKSGIKTFSQKYISNGIDKNSESIFFVNGDVYGAIDDTKRVGIAFDMNNLSYSSDLMKDYLALFMNPYFSIKDDNYYVRLGAHVDAQTGNNKGFVMAPNIKGEYYFSDGYVLYASLDGGRVLNDLFRLNELSPYFSILNQLPSTFVPLDASIGFKASPMNGLWFNVFGGYRISKHEVSYGYPSENFYYTNFIEDKANSGYLGGEIKYNYKDKFETSLKSVYYNWTTKADNKDYFLASKPKTTLDFDIKVEVIDKLKVGAGYQYEKCGKIPSMVLYNKKIGNINNLYLNCNYNIFNDINIFAKVNNVLNKQYYLKDGYPVEKFNFIGGLSFTF